ncbi:MAG: glycosyltransferase [Desulfomonilaceae bacterium]
MRIFLLTDYYQQYLKSFEKQWNNVVSGLGYKEHQELLLQDYFGSWVSYRNHFRNIGHTCELVIGNYLDLQYKWAREQGVKIKPSLNRYHQVVLEQIEAFQPDAFIVSSSFQYYGQFMQNVRAITPNIFSWISCPFPESLDLVAISCIISSADYFVDEFRKRGKNAELLRAGFDADILQGIGSLSKDIPVSFVGGLGADTHSFRISYLERLIEDGVPLKVWGYGLKRRWLPFGRSPIEKCYQGECFGMEMFRVLARSQITLNFHIDIIKGHNWVGNMRMYEGTGCGSMLITDHGENICDIFVPGREIETFSDYEDLKRKAIHYLDHFSDAEAVAQAGQKRCLKDHGCSSRIRNLESILCQYSI